MRSPLFRPTYSRLSPLSILIVGLLGGCTFALDDPAPFIVEAQPDPDGFVPQDMAPDGSRLDARLDSQASDGSLPDHALDAHPDVMMTPDIAVAVPDVAVADIRPPDMTRPDMLMIPDMAPPCVPQDETCDGTDEDCDGEIDEEALGLCDPCETGQLGVCGVGRQLCIEGITTCVTHLPEDVGFPCDRVDLDCDGQLDEGDEVIPPSNDLTTAAIATCGVREAVPAPIADCSVEPRRVGCSPSHACVPPGCRVRCEMAFAESQDRNILDACLTTCPADSRAARWICAEGPEGPTCTATDCPEGEQPDGRRCVPIVEICNNGIDDDDDGLIDGTIEGDDPCMAAIDQRGQPTVSGICEQPNVAGCEDTLQMIAGGSVNNDSVCVGLSCPRVVDLDYAYTIDREEVSIRAYAECVASGCCLAPSSRTYRLGAQAIADGVSPERVAEPERCAPPLDELDPGTLPLLPELPVTGVTWCQARDYCNWVGKRLPTDYEWERAASGLERRAFPWGNEIPAQCSENQCCTAPDFEGDLPGLCGGDTPICSDEIPARTRLACLANYGYDVEGCDPVIGPTPVYANADGDTPEGIRNLSGNVAEWTFDWLGHDIAQTSRQNPVGAACDNTFFPGKRTVRGEGFTGVLEGIRAIDRAGLFPQVRAPMLGFRCARTQPEDNGACDPQTPQIPQECQAGADIRIAQPGQPIGAACTAPDFANAPAADAAECPGLNLGRLGSGQCNDGLQDYCASDDQIGCGAFLLSRLRLPQGVFFNNSWSNIANTVFDSTLGPRGGSSLFAFELPEAFETNVNREWRMTIGSAQVDVDGRLSWLGKFDAGICSRQEISSFRIRTVQGQRTVLPVCGEVGRARISLRDAPISIIFSGIGIQMTHIPAAGLLQGKLVFAVTLQDTEESTFGPTGSGVSQLINNLGLDAQNLCAISNPFLGPNCFAHRLQLEGCNNQVCNNPETCTGYLLPFDFEAVRSTQAGIIGLDGCAVE